MKLIKKLLGHKYENRYTWGELYTGFKCRDLSFRYTDGGCGGCDLIIISVPFLFKSYIHASKEKDNGWNSKEWSYGFYVYSWREDVVFSWGSHSYRFEFPWMLKWQKTEILDFNNNVLIVRTTKDKNVYEVGGKFDQEEEVKKKWNEFKNSLRTLFKNKIDEEWKIFLRNDSKYKFYLNVIFL